MLRTACRPLRRVTRSSRRGAVWGPYLVHSLLRSRPRNDSLERWKPGAGRKRPTQQGGNLRGERLPCRLLSPQEPPFLFGGGGLLGTHFPAPGRGCGGKPLSTSSPAPKGTCGPHSCRFRMARVDRCLFVSGAGRARGLPLPLLSQLPSCPLQSPTVNWLQPARGPSPAPTFTPPPSTQQRGAPS